MLLKNERGVCLVRPALAQPPPVTLDLTSTQTDCIRDHPGGGYSNAPTTSLISPAPGYKLPRRGLHGVEACWCRLTQAPPLPSSRNLHLGGGIAYIHMYIHTYVHTYIYTYIDTYTHTYTETHMHTYTHT